MRAHTLLAIAVFASASSMLADSHAYVFASGFDYDTPGSVVPLNTATGIMGAPYFVPAGVVQMAVAPGTNEIWQATTGCFVNCPFPFGINILNSKTGATIATVSLTAQAGGLLFDGDGKYVYTNIGNGEAAGPILKIDVASRAVVETSSFSTGTCGMVLSTDGEKLFASCSTGLFVLNPRSLAVLTTLPYSGGMLVSGNTLLISAGTTLYYIDTATYAQTNSVPLPTNSEVFGVSPEGTEVYVGLYCYVCFDPTPPGIEVLDFSSGELLRSQTFSGVGGTEISAFFYLSPNGSQMAIVSDQVLLIDPATLQVNKTVVAIAATARVAFAGTDDLLMMYPNTAAMMVIDGSTAQVTTTFPLSIILGSGEVSDPVHGLVFIGGGTTNYLTGSNVSVVSTKYNRVIGNLAADGMAPGALAADQLYGAATVIGEGPYAVNLKTRAYTPLPLPVHDAESSFTWFFGGAPPNGETYWIPFVVQSQNGIIVVSAVAVYNTTTNALAAFLQVPASSSNPMAFSPDGSSRPLS